MIELKMVDILVVGGGIAGLSVAGRLSKSANVTLLEAEENLGYHSSSRSAAAFTITSQIKVLLSVLICHFLSLKSAAITLELV